MKYSKNIKFISWLLTMLVLMVGVYAVFTATNKKEEDAKALKKSLQQQEIALKEKEATVETSEGAIHANQAYGHLESKAKTNLESVTFIGDSVMLGSSAALQGAMPNAIIDAKESRQIWDAPGIIKDLDKNHRLGETVVIGLGTNSPFTLEYGQNVIRSLGENRHIFWINVFGPMDWTDKSNESIQNVVNANQNVTLIDWHAYAKDHKDWFYRDGIHLRPEGAKEYANFILKSLS